MRIPILLAAMVLMQSYATGGEKRSPYYSPQSVMDEKEKLLSRCLMSAVQTLDDDITPADKIAAVAAEHCDPYFRDFVKAVAGPNKFESVYYESRSSAAEEATKKLLWWRSMKRNSR